MSTRDVALFCPVHTHRPSINKIALFLNIDPCNKSVSEWNGLHFALYCECVHHTYDYGRHLNRVVLYVATQGTVSGLPHWDVASSNGDNNGPTGNLAETTTRFSASKERI